jgi:FixJ family two-component response regulator
MKIAVPYLLLVDDDPADAQMLIDRIRLVKPTIDVLQFSDGYDALAHLEACKSDHLPIALITDYSMPSLNGAQFLRLLQPQKRYGNIVKFVWSTSRMPMEECQRAGAIDFFVKPSQASDLSAIVHTLMTHLALPTVHKT